jgi:2-desacetyl-2-hydroxyethyl bacteriochlorophyllide A dehydrogenase
MNDPRGTHAQSPQHGARRSQGQIVVARALWHVKPGQSEIRTERLNPVRPGDVRVATEYSAISRGSERLVALGEVPASEWPRMRAPMQQGEFSFPVKYGYSATGTVTVGPEPLIGRRVFALHPHQDHFQVPEAMVTIIPDTIPAKRATLAANMETALNAHWDAGTAPADRILVIGAGIVGLLVAYLARRIAGTEVTIADIDPARAHYAAALGLAFATPGEAPENNRIVFHASATSAGLESALEKCAFEGTVVELSWYGTKPVTLRLGAAFHSRRLKIISSQVGHVAPNQRQSVSHRNRLAKAISLLDDAALDALVTDEIAFDDLPAGLARIWSSASDGLPPVVRY